MRAYSDDIGAEEATTEPLGLGDDQETYRQMLEDMRGSVAKIADSLQSYAAHPQEAAADAMQATRDGIRAHPGVAMGVFALLGAGAAVLLLSATARPTPQSNFSRAWSHVPSRADLMDMAREAQGAAMRIGRNHQSLLTLGERVVDSLTSMDPQRYAPTLEKAMEWIGSLAKGR